MNINMQESYWAADVAGVSEVFGPLMKFIQGLCVCIVGENVLIWKICYDNGICESM